MRNNQTVPELIKQIRDGITQVNARHHVAVAEMYIRRGCEELESRGMLAMIADMFTEVDYREMPSDDIRTQVGNASVALSDAILSRDPVKAHTALTRIIKGQEELDRRREAEHAKGPEGLRELLKFE